MKLKILILLVQILLTDNLIGQNLSRPSVKDLNVNTLKWERTGESTFRLFYKPNGYTFNPSQDYRYFSLENGDVVIFCLIDNHYWQLNEFNYAPKNVEMDMNIVSFKEAVFIRSQSGSFWILDRGLNVSAGLEFIQFNSDGTAVYQSTSTGRRYWIPSGIYKNGSFNTVYSITSE